MGSTIWTDGSAWGLVTLLLIVALSYPTARLTSILRSDHPEVYREIGRPRWFWGGDPGVTWRFSRFLFSGRALGLGDARVSRLCTAIRVLYVLAVAWVALPFLLIAYLAAFVRA